MVKLWSHQTDMVDFARSRSKSLLYSDMATGKTLVGLEWLNALSGLFLIIAPKAALPVWEEDWRNLLDGARFDITTLDTGSSKSKAKIIEDEVRHPGSRAFVVNYETAWRLPLSRYKWAAVVADEVHKVGTYNSKQTIELTRLLSDVPNKLGLTGTPYHDGYESLYGITRFLDPIIPPNTRAHPVSPLFGKYDDFLDEFCHTYNHSPGVRFISGYKHLARLSEIIKPMTMRVKISDVHDMPPEVNTKHFAPLTGEVKKAYRDLKKDNVVEVNDLTIVQQHVLPKIGRLQMLANSGTIRHLDQEIVLSGLQKRVDVLTGFLKQIGPDEPVVIFTKWRADVDLIRKAVNEPVHLLTGDIDNHQDWRGGAGRILIANLDAGSEGVRLERAHHAIFWSPGFSLRTYMQARSRIARPTQKAPTVFFHHILSADTIDVDVYNVLARKTKNLQALDERIE